MTTLICDFRSIVGEKIEGYATLTAGKVRPSYNSPAVLVHEPIKQVVTAGQTTFENVNPGDAVITVEWADQTQSATIRFVVPDSEEAIYLADCLSADSLDPTEIELLRWGIRENLSGAREMLEEAKNLGLTAINGTVDAYFTEAAEILRKALEAAHLAEQSLGTIDDKVSATEGVVTDVDEAKQQIQGLLDELAALGLELDGAHTDLAGAVGKLNALTPQVSAATQAASAATQKAQTAVNELNNVQNANEAEFNLIKKDLDSATKTAKQATDAVAQTNQQLGIEVQRILGEVDEALGVATEATAQARIANENLETYQYQLGEISQEQGRILSQQAEIVGSYEFQLAELDRLSSEISTAASELEGISGDQAALVTEMNTQVGSLQELTAAQGAAINAAKSQADKGVTDAAAASNALSAYKKVNDPKVVAAQSTADTARAEATSKANAARTAAEKVAKELADKAQADAEVAAAAEALRIAQEEATAAKNAASADATAKANAARTAAENLAKAQAKAAQEAAELTAAQDASEKANKAKADAEAKAATLANAAEQAAATALTGYKNLNDPKVSKAQADATKGINDAAAARSAANQAALDATNKALAAQEAAEDYAREAAEAAQAQALETAAAEALRVAKAQANAAKAAAATDAKAKADEAERLAKVYADAQAKTAKEQAEANAAKDAATKADNARIAAEANAKVLSDKAQQAANAAQSSIDNLEIGGRNLARRRNLAGTGQYQSVVDTGEKFWTGEPIYYGEKLTSGTPPTSLSSNIRIEPGETYTISMWIKGETNSGTINGNILFYDVRANKSLGGTKTGTPAAEWHLISGTFTNETDAAYESVALYFYLNRNPGEKTWFTSPKLEHGNKPTDWTPAPEDVDASIATAQAEAELAREEAVSKANAARAAAEKYAKEQAEAAQADAEVEAARVALEIAQREAKAAKDAAAQDATAKANAARTAAETLAKAEAKAAKEAAEATAAADASTKANKAKTDAEAKAATLATAAQNAAATALSTYKGQNDPKVTKAQNDATSGITKADAAKKQADKGVADAATAKARADKGVTDAATALARANEANNKLPAITADVSAAAQSALEAVNALPGIRTDISNAKKQADKGVQDAATAKTAVDNLQIGGRNYFLNSGGDGAPVTLSSNHGSVYPITQGKDEHGAWVQGKYTDGSGWFISSYTNPTYEQGYGKNFSPDFLNVKAPYTQSIEVMCMEPVSVAVGGGAQVELTPGVWTRISRTQTGNNQVRAYGITANPIGDIPESTRLYHRKWKLEAGTKATDWTPAPEDVDSGIATAQTLAETARTEAETKANQALQNATTALTNYQKVNDPKVSTAQSTANTAKSAADTAKQRADKGVSDAATAKSAADTAKARADKGVSDAAAAKQAADKVGTDLENLQIGGRNLIAHSAIPRGAGSAASGITSTITSEGLKVVAATTNQNYVSMGGNLALTAEGKNLTVGELVTFSVEIKTEDATALPRFYAGAGMGYTQLQGKISPVFSRVSWTQKWNLTSWAPHIGFQYSPGTFVLRNFKLERGNKATDWSPAPEDTQAEINALITKADDLTTGLSNAATQKDYNDLNTRLWGGQGEINKLQSDINANNQAFQTWQKTINDQQAKWNKASSDATAALARFAITQAQWNDISSKATNANTKAIASHAALFEGQNKWNEVAAAAIQTQANFATKQKDWNAVQEKVNTNFQNWQNAATEMLTSTGKFQKLQNQFNSDQKKWNATQTLVNDAQKGINALNTRTDQAQSNALKGIQQILNMVYPAQSIVLYHPEKNIPVWEENSLYNNSGTAYGGSSVDTANLPTGVSRAIKVVGQNTYGVNTYSAATVDPNIEYKYSFWMKAAQTGTRIYIEVRDQDGNHAIQTNTADKSSPQGNTTNYLANSMSVSTSWTKYSGTIKFKNTAQRVRFGSIYYNHPNGVAGTQWLADIQITPNMPSQAAVDKAQNDAITALNRFAVTQSQWNTVSNTATNANTAALAAKKVLDDNQSRWIQAADLAITNLQTSSAKFKEWTDGATTAIALNRELIGEQGLIQENQRLQMEALQEAVAEQTKLLYDELQSKPEIITVGDGQSYYDSRITVNLTKSGSRVSKVTVHANGTWAGIMHVEADHGKSDGPGSTFMNYTPLLQKVNLVNTTSRDIVLTRNTSVDHIGKVRITYWVYPGVVLTTQKTGSSITVEKEKWLTLHTFTAADTATFNAELQVGWDAAGRGPEYGVRLTVNGTSVASDGPRNGVGPDFPWQDGYRQMSIKKTVVVQKGQTVRWEAYVSSGSTNERRIRNFNARATYMYRGLTEN